MQTTSIFTLDDVLLSGVKPIDERLTKLDMLLMIKDKIGLLLTLTPDDRLPYLEAIAMLELTANEKYIPLYLEMTKLTDLWSVYGLYKMTPLHQLCYNGHEMFCEVLDELTKKKFDEPWKLKNDGKTTLHFLILSCYAHARYKLNNIITGLTKFINLWMIPDDNQDTALHVLCRQRTTSALPILEILAEHRALWSIQNKKQETPLHILCIHKPEEDIEKYTTIFKILTKYTGIWHIKAEYGYTPLHFFCRGFALRDFSEIYSTLQSHADLWMMQNASGATPTMPQS